MKTAKSAGAVADRATVIVDTVRPIVVKAMNDPELHEALRKAFSTGKDVKDEISGKSATQAAQKIAANRKLQKKVEESAQDLQKAVKGVVEPPKKKGRIKRTHRPHRDHRRRRRRRHGRAAQGARPGRRPERLLSLPAGPRIV